MIRFYVCQECCKEFSLINEHDIPIKLICPFCESKRLTFIRNSKMKRGE